MSKTPRISYIVEGKTDYIVLDALVEPFLGTDDYIANQIQPPTSEFANDQGPLGGGWRGVLKWCESEGSSAVGFADGVVLLNSECLFIHVDADIAYEPDLATQVTRHPCPPASTTCDELRDFIKSKLGTNLPDKVVLCVPSKCTEVWVFVALYPQEAARYDPIECRQEPERLLIGKGERLVRDKGGVAKKQADRYRGAATRIVHGWRNATELCPEALRFETDAKAVLRHLP